MTRYLPLSILKTAASHIGPGNDDHAYQNCLDTKKNSHFNNIQHNFDLDTMSPPCSALEYVDCTDEMPGGLHVGRNIISNTVLPRGGSITKTVDISDNSVGLTDAAFQQSLNARSNTTDTRGSDVSGMAFGHCTLTCYNHLFEDTAFVHEMGHYIHFQLIIAADTPDHPYYSESITITNKIEEAADYLIDNWSDDAYAKVRPPYEFFAECTYYWFLGNYMTGRLSELFNFIKEIPTTDGTIEDLLTQLYGPSINIKEALQSLNISASSPNYDLLSSHTT